MNFPFCFSLNIEVKPWKIPSIKLMIFERKDIFLNFSLNIKKKIIPRIPAIKPPIRKTGLIVNPEFL